MLKTLSYILVLHCKVSKFVMFSDLLSSKVDGRQKESDGCRGEKEEKERTKGKTNRLKKTKGYKQFAREK